MATRAKYRNIFKWHLFSHKPKHHLICQDSGDRSSALLFEIITCDPSIYMYTMDHPDLDLDFVCFWVAVLHRFYCTPISKLTEKWLLARFVLSTSGYALLTATICIYNTICIELDWPNCEKTCFLWLTEQKFFNISLAWRKLSCYTFQWTNNKGADQTAWMHTVVCAFDDCV